MMNEHTHLSWQEAAIAWLKPFSGPLLFVAGGVLVIVLLGLAQRIGWISAGGGGGATTAAAGEADQQYICPMMCVPPTLEPGRCPVCGMELVPAADDAGDGDRMSVTIDPASRRIANIQTATAKEKAVARRINAVGEIQYDESKLKTLAAYVDGRIDALYADYTGVVVNQGDELALLYSPELYTAQSELISALRASQRGADSSLYSGTLSSQGLLTSARRKLADLGMTDEQIKRVESTGQPVSRIKLVAPIHGTVIDRLAAEGEYVKTGEAIYRLADLSTVWLMLELFPEEAAAIRYGQRVDANVESLPGETFTGRVAFVDPMLNRQTRTIGVRVVIQNPDGRLKVGDYATAVIQTPVLSQGKQDGVIYDPELAGKWISPRHPHVIEDRPGNCKLCGITLVPATQFGFTSEPVDDHKHLVVPRNAVLMAGDNSVVYVEVESGRFQLRQVKLGPTIGDEIVLLSGVKPGEAVATNGNFLIDSQMQLAGNPSLIDPTKAKPSTDHQHNEMQDPKILAALAELSEEHRKLAMEQRICPVTEAPLGSMGPPKAVEVKGRTVFICCEGCRESLLEEPEKYFAVLEEYKRKRDEQHASHEETPANVPPIGSMQLPDEDDNEPAPGSLPPIGPKQMEVQP